MYFRLKGCFTKKMEEAILAGIPTTFTSYVELKRVRGFWFDKEIASVEVKHTIKYDAVKKLFFVTFQKDGNEEEAHQLTSFSEARDTMSDVNGIVLAPLGAMERGARYYVRVKSRMDRFRLPLHMEYVLAAGSGPATGWRGISRRCAACCAGSRSRSRSAGLQGSNQRRSASVR